jgi:hypothetical protein
MVELGSGVETLIRDNVEKEKKLKVSQLTKSKPDAKKSTS